MKSHIEMDDFLVDQFFDEEKTLLSDDFLPYWLLTNPDASVWEIHCENKTRLVNGVYVGTLKIYWTHKLPNGHKLTDPPYKALLSNCRRLAILYRSGPEGTASSKQLVTFCYYLFRLIDWMILEGLDPFPGALDFSSLKPQHFDLFLSSLPEGLFGLLKIEDRFLDAYAKLSAEQKCQVVVDGQINVKLAAELIGEEKNLIAQPKSIMLLERSLGIFEREGKFAIGQSNAHRAYVGHRDKTFAEIADSPFSASAAASFLTVWKMLHVYGAQVSGLTWNPLADASTYGLSLGIGCKEKKRTPRIPKEIAFSYIDNVVSWIHEFGPALVEYYKSVRAELMRVQAQGTARRDYRAPQAYANIAQPPEISALSITRFNRSSKFSRKESRINPSGLALEDAIRCLRAACFIAIAAFTARRLDEILSLDEDCIKAGVDGFDIHFSPKKLVIIGQAEPLSRPVPDLVVRAVDLLKRISSIYRAEVLHDPLLSKTIWLCEGQRGITQLSPDMAYSALDLFTDLINVPSTDRPCWYSRSHEWRKFFAISFFWQEHIPASLSALSWFLGHLGPQETMRYITEDLRGEEISEEFAQVVVESLRKKMPNTSDSGKMEELIQSHFGVDDIELVEPDYLEHFIEQLLHDQKVRVIPSAIPSGNGHRTTMIVRVAA